MSLGETHRPLRDVVCAAIREQIVGGLHRPGERLVEDRLASELGVSRSPVREALRVLEVEGYVDIIPRKGVIVATLSRDEAAEIFEVRVALESLAARLAARKATADAAARLNAIITEAERVHGHHDVAMVARCNTEFHGLVLELAGNGYLSDVMIPLRGRMQWIFSQTAGGDRGADSIEEHRRLAKAIADRDEDEAARAAADHVRSAQATYEAYRSGAPVS